MRLDNALSMLSPWLDTDLYAVLAASACLVALSAAALAASERYRRVRERRAAVAAAAEAAWPGEREAVAKGPSRAALAASMLSCAVLILSAAVLLAASSVFLEARRHGFRGRGSVDAAVTASSLAHAISLSPEEDAPPEDLTCHIIYYYRFGCKDCEALYPDLERRLEAIAPVVRIATRSEAGSALLETFPAASVPSCTYVKHDGSQLHYRLFDEASGGPDEAALAGLERAVVYDGMLKAASPE